MGRSLGTLSDETKLTSWLYAITLNTVRDRLRKRGVDADRVEAVHGDAESEAEAADPVSQVPHPEARSNLRSATR